eukprot:COSAG04_NODE_3959_length_2396_cov_7.354375_6_plen_25_part_01
MLEGLGVERRLRRAGGALVANFLWR